MTLLFITLEMHNNELKETVLSQDNLESVPMTWHAMLEGYK